MPDSDRASLPLQIAGQAGNDERKPAMTICGTGNDESALKTKLPLSYLRGIFVRCLAHDECETC